MRTIVLYSRHVAAHAAQVQQITDKVSAYSPSVEVFDAYDGGVGSTLLATLGPRDLPAIVFVQDHLVGEIEPAVMDAVIAEQYDIEAREFHKSTHDYLGARIQTHTEAGRDEIRAIASKFVAIDNITDEQLTEALSMYQRWAPDTEYIIGSAVVYEGKLYRVNQTHTSQSDWLPPSVPALYTERVPPNVIPNWTQPLGGHDAYPLGALVVHNGQTWASTVDANVWEPGVYGWGVYTV